jgi:hypothetical protein
MKYYLDNASTNWMTVKKYNSRPYKYRAQKNQHFWHSIKYFFIIPFFKKNNHPNKNPLIMRIIKKSTENKIRRIVAGELFAFNFNSTYINRFTRHYMRRNRLRAPFY